MKKSFTIVALIVMSVYCYADDNEEYVVTHPKITPIYVGKTLFCSLIAYDLNETPCDPEPRLKVYSHNAVDTIHGALYYEIHFDTINAQFNTELPVLEINDVTIFRCDKPELNMEVLLPEFYEELQTRHYWLGNYINHQTLYPWQQWATKFIVIPK